VSEVNRHCVEEVFMIVSHKYKFIFLKTRKTAGTSVEIALSNYCGEEDIITPIPNEDERIRRDLGYRGPQNFSISFSQYTIRDWGKLLLKKRTPACYNHMSAARIRALVKEEVWDSYYKFTLERNPWDKAVSCYYWRTKGGGPRLPFSEYLYSEDPNWLSNFGIYTINNQIAVDHVIHYENLSLELEQFARRFKLLGELELPKAKGSTRKDKRHYREIIGPGEYNHIRKICAREIELFGYCF
jgi:hypothetical protein